MAITVRKILGRIEELDMQYEALSAIENPVGETDNINNWLLENLGIDLETLSAIRTTIWGEKSRLRDVLEETELDIRL